MHPPAAAALPRSTPAPRAGRTSRWYLPHIAQPQVEGVPLWGGLRHKQAVEDVTFTPSFVDAGRPDGPLQV